MDFLMYLELRQMVEMDDPAVPDLVGDQVREHGIAEQEPATGSDACRKTKRFSKNVFLYKNVLP